MQISSGATAAFPAFPSRPLRLAVRLPPSSSISATTPSYNHFSFFPRIRQISSNSCLVPRSNFHAPGVDCRVELSTCSRGDKKFFRFSLACLPIVRYTANGLETNVSPFLFLFFFSVSLSEGGIYLGGDKIEFIDFIRINQIPFERTGERAKLKHSSKHY